MRLRNITVFLWWSLAMFLITTNVTLVIGMSIILLAAAPFAKWIAPNGDQVDIAPSRGMQRFNNLYTMTMMSVTKAALMSGDLEPPKFKVTDLGQGG